MGNATSGSAAAGKAVENALHTIGALFESRDVIELRALDTNDLEFRSFCLCNCLIVRCRIDDQESIWLKILISYGF